MVIAEFSEASPFGRKKDYTNFSPGFLAVIIQSRSGNYNTIKGQNSIKANKNMKQVWFLKDYDKDIVLLYLIKIRKLKFKKGFWLRSLILAGISSAAIVKGYISISIINVQPKKVSHDVTWH